MKLFDKFSVGDQVIFRLHQSKSNGLVNHGIHDLRPGNIYTIHAIPHRDHAILKDEKGVLYPNQNGTSYHFYPDMIESVTPIKSKRVENILDITRSIAGGSF